MNRSSIIILVLTVVTAPAAFGQIAPGSDHAYGNRVIEVNRGKPVAGRVNARSVLRSYRDRKPRVSSCRVSGGPCFPGAFTTPAGSYVTAVSVRDIPVVPMRAGSPAMYERERSALRQVRLRSIASDMDADRVYEAANEHELGSRALVVTGGAELPTLR